LRPTKRTNPPKRKSKKPSSSQARQIEHPKLQEILRQVLKVEQLKEDLLLEAAEYCEDNNLSLEDALKVLNTSINKHYDQETKKGNKKN